MTRLKINNRGITLLEVLVAMGVFVLFALGIYGGINMIFKIVYNSRMRILETAILSEKLEEVRNIPFNQVGILNGAPSGVLPYTQSIARNGKTFNIITTVRNIDDPFDGMATGTPQIDTAPADYKLVEMSIICQGCLQSQPIILSTRVSPKGLEGASNNGSLFIHLFDADGQNIQGANVNVVYMGSSTLNINDVTDNDGMLRIIDIPTGTEKYVITVGKSGYSTDKTVTSSPSNPNPDKPPSTVVKQTVTEINFSIDQLANLSLDTLNPSCSAIGSVSFNIYGTKTIGHNPTVYKYNKNLTTNSSGYYGFGNMEWDMYYLSTTNTSYDIAGSIPVLPVDLTPGMTQEAKLILQPHTAYSMLVTVRDAATLQPLSDAVVRLSKTGYDQSATTSIGYVRQTDWSGGSGQAIYSDNTRYFSDNGNIDNDSPVGSLTLRKTGNVYQSPGDLESSTFDMGEDVTYRNLVFEPLSQPASTSVKFQLATSNSSTPAQWNFVGPDGNSDTYYTSTSTLIYDGHDGQRYMRYKLFLQTSKTSATPQLSDILFTYTNQCTPPGQVFFNSLSSGTYTLEVRRSGYDTVTDTNVVIDGSEQMIVNLSTI